ncbi:hypothetical protein BCR43DRAFT_566176 [Syncephalastrum racemosum]|uniref:Uncharacterized protein n=1 Tax=Syncephalastrum racemosum TaxID=13706 RepID=A0A1X2H208_SYNRA|nr:hypothetical protein BCR43DRAFT_566176 [Syncephalastrum racemosum]
MSSAPVVIIPSEQPKFKSLISRPSMRLWRSNKTAPFDANKKPVQEEKVVELKETGKNEIYELSTINDSGVYLPPQAEPASKRDRWLEVHEDDLTFRLPSPDRLTKSHLFFTPSSTIRA